MFLKRSRAWMTVEPIMLVYMFASFLTYPTFQQLLYSSVCSTTPNCTQPSSINDTHVQRSCGNESSPVEEEVRTKVSHWILYNNLATSIPAILSAIFYGSFSDVYGRRIFIVLPAVGGMLNAVVVLSVSYFSPGKVYLYLIGSFVIGLTGGFSVLNFATYSYMADVSTVDQRTLKLSLLESMMYLGATLSSFVSGVWIKRDGFAPPYWGILACYTVVAMYTVLFLPETSTKKSLLLETRTTYGYSAVSSNSSFSNSSCRANILSSIVSRIFHFFYLLFTSWRVALLCFVFFVVEINFLGVTDIIVLYSINKLCWSSDWIGYFLGSKVFFNAVAALVCLPLLTAFFKATDTTILLMGLTSSVAALVTMGTASKTWIMLLGMIFFVFVSHFFIIFFCSSCNWWNEGVCRSCYSLNVV